MPTQLNENLSDSLVLSDAFEYSLGVFPLTLHLSDQLVMSDAWQLLMINPSGSTQGAWSLEIGERMLMADHFSNPNALTSQVAMEVVQLPADAKARLSQGPVEVVILATDAHARVSQVAVEVVAKTPQGYVTGAQIQMRIQ
jgi:hypothetical protein